MTYPASAKQIALLARLIDEKDMPDTERDTLLDTGPMTSREASTLIDRLFALPRKPQTVVEPGYYLLDGDAYTVVTARNGSGNTYAKRFDLNAGRWEYAPGAIRKLAGVQPMTLEQAKEFGHEHGWCAICGRTLSDPKSVEAGIGPVCAKKFA